MEFGMHALMILNRLKEFHSSKMLIHLFLKKKCFCSIENK
jgi:hypothetical protein